MEINLLDEDGWIERTSPPERLEEHTYTQQGTLESSLLSHGLEERVVVVTVQDGRTSRAPRPDS